MKEIKVPYVAIKSINEEVLDIILCENEKTLKHHFSRGYLYVKNATIKIEEGSCSVSGTGHTVILVDDPITDWVAFRYGLGREMSPEDGAEEIEGDFDVVSYRKHFWKPYTEYVKSGKYIGKETYPFKIMTSMFTIVNWSENISKVAKAW